MAGTSSVLPPSPDESGALCDAAPTLGATRRGFLGLFLAAAAGAALPDPDRLNWVPGAKTIFIPDTPRLYFHKDMFSLVSAGLPLPRGNQLLTIEHLTHEVLRVLEENLVVTRKINREYDSKFAIEGAKIGSVLRVQLPARFPTRLDLLHGEMSLMPSPADAKTETLNHAIDRMASEWMESEQ